MVNVGPSKEMLHAALKWNSVWIIVFAIKRQNPKNKGGYWSDEGLEKSLDIPA